MDCSVTRNKAAISWLSCCGRFFHFCAKIFFFFLVQMRLFWVRNLLESDHCVVTFYFLSNAP